MRRMLMPASLSNGVAKLAARIGFGPEQGCARSQRPIIGVATLSIWLCICDPDVAAADRSRRRFPCLPLRQLVAT
jgi:hypothetical protein